MMCLTYWNSFIFALQDEYRHGTYLRDCRNRENQSLPANCYHTKTDFIGPLIWESCQNENCNENSVAAACLAHQNILHSYPAVVLQTKYLPEKGGVSMFMQFMIFLWFPHTHNKQKGRRLMPKVMKNFHFLVPSLSYLENIWSIRGGRTKKKN